MTLDEFKEILHSNGIYLQWIVHYNELFEEITDHTATRAFCNDIISDMNNLELHYYPNRMGGGVLGGISKKSIGVEEIQFNVVNLKRDFYKYVYVDEITKTIDLTKNQSLKCLHNEPMVKEFFKYMPSEYTTRKLTFSIPTYCKDFKFKLTIKEGRKNIYSKTYSIKNGLSQDDYNEIKDLYNDTVRRNINQYHVDKLKEYLL